MTFTGMTGDTTQMHVAAGHVMDAHSAITAHRAQVQSYQAEIASGWNSGAHTQYFNGPVMETHNEAGLILGHLEAMQAALHQTGTRYQANDDHVAVGANRFAGLLNR